MRRISAFILASMLAAVVAAPAMAAPATGITATPAATESFDGGNCTATFVRSASGIINETNRVCAGSQNPWTSADVWLQFRPLTGPDGTGSPIPNPTCNPTGLVTTSFTFSNSEASIGGTTTQGYFIGSNPYNVCVYLVNPMVASGTVDSASASGTTVTLPTGLSGQFEIAVSGEWFNATFGLVDAQYNNGYNGYNEAVTWQEGWPGLGACWGRLFVNGACVDWGAFNPAHAYSYTLSASGSITLNVNDTYYPDNVGSLSFTVTYLGL